MRTDGVDDTNLVPKPAGLFGPRGIVAGVIVGKDDDLVTLTQIQPARDEVVCLAGIARDYDLFGTNTEVLGKRLPGGFFSLLKLPPIVRRRVFVDRPRVVVEIL